MTAEPSHGPADAAESAVVRAVDVDRLVALTSRLVAVPSVSAEESPGQHLVAELLADAGATVEVTAHDLPTLAMHPSYSAEFDRDELLGVVGVVGDGGDGPTLLVDGHVDVVPPGLPGDWTTPAFAPAVRDGALYGRGACDMKGGLAAAIHALEAIDAAGVELAGEVAVASVAAEEDGGAGTLGLLTGGMRADACVIPEPTGLAVVPAVAGALSWRITLRGLAAHGALREEGVSAIEKLPVVLDAVGELERRRNRDHADPLFAWLDRPFAICGGRVAGGDWPSSEADWLTWEGRYGVAPGEDLAAARAELEQAVADAAAQDPWLAAHPPEVSWWGGQFLPARTDPAAPIVTTTTASLRDVTGDADVRGMPYGCDMGLTVGVAGIPTVVFGPGDIRAAHRPDEHVPVADLAVASRVLALTMMRTCGVV